MRSSRTSFNKKSVSNVIECQGRGEGGGGRGEVWIPLLCLLTLRTVVSLGQTLRYAGRET